MFEYYINRFLQLMDYQVFTVVMKPKKSDNGEITKVPIYIIRSDGILKTFNELSGGEKQRLILSEILAIKHIVEGLVGVNYNIIWLDEVLDISLDNVGVNKIRDMLKKIAEEKQYSVELVSHIQDMVFENKLIIKKENGWSSIIENYA